MLNYTDITQNTYIQSWMVTAIYDLFTKRTTSAFQCVYAGRGHLNPVRFSALGPAKG